jgi:5-methylcytosine-specific restriction protein A
MKLCRCGQIVKDRCLKCSPIPQHKKTTAERGYDSRWKRLSESIRKNNPLCHDCLENDMVTPATEVHHIIKIADAPQLKYERTNLVQLCTACHERRHNV